MNSYSKRKAEIASKLVELRIRCEAKDISLADVLTEREYDIWLMKEAQQSFRTISILVGVGEQRVRQILEEARSKIAQQLIRRYKNA